MKQQLEGQINVLKEQINTARINEEPLCESPPYDPAGVGCKKEQKAGFVKDSEAIHGQLERISNQDTDAKRAADPGAVTDCRRDDGDRAE